MGKERLDTRTDKTGKDNGRAAPAAAPVSDAVRRASAGRSVAIEIPVASVLGGNQHTTWSDRPDPKLSPRETRALQHVLQACNPKTPVGLGSPGVTVTTEGHALRMLLEKIADALGL